MNNNNDDDKDGHLILQQFHMIVIPYSKSKEVTSLYFLVKEGEVICAWNVVHSSPTARCSIPMMHSDSFSVLFLTPAKQSAVYYF